MSRLSEPKKEFKKQLDSQYAALSKEQISQYATKERFVSIALFSFCALFSGIMALYLLLLPNDPVVGIFSLVFGIVFCVLAGGFVIYMFFDLCKENNTLAKRHLKGMLKRQPKSLFEQSELLRTGFTVSKEVVLKTSSWHACKMFIDGTQKRFVIKSGDLYGNFLKFEDILGYEVIENGKSQVQGRTGSALIGGAFFGLGGAIVGSSRSRSIDEKCTHLSLIIRIKNLDSPQIELVFLKNTNIDKSSTIYKDKISNIQVICSHLEYMINSKEDEKTITKNSNHNTPTTKKEELQELKEMLDDGLITPEDYEQKKKQILGL